MARPIGSKNKFSIHDFAKEADAQEFLEHVKAKYKENDRLATWYGDHLFGKAPQPLEGKDGKDLYPSSVDQMSNEELEKIIKERRAS